MVVSNVLSRSFQWFVTALLLLYPVAALAIHNAGNAIFYSMLLASLASLALRIRPAGMPGFASLLRRYWPLCLALAATVLAVFLQQASAGQFAFKHYDRALRLALFPLVLWILMLVDLKHLKLLTWSFMAAALVLAVKAYLFTDGGVVRDGNIGFISVIAYSNIALLFGVLSLCAFRGEGRVQKPLCLLAFLAGAYTGVLTQTRGGWVAVGLFVVFFFSVSRMNIGRKLLCVLALALALGAMFSFNEAARERLFNTSSEISSYAQGEQKSTAVGIRLQLWGAALKLFARNPVFGIGRDNYEPNIKAMADRGEVTRELTTLAHSHNELLFSMAISGIFGAAALLAVYLVPAWYFASHLRDTSPDCRVAAQSGCLIVIGFFAFGLTDLMFFWPVLDGLYVILLAAFLVQVKKSATPVPIVA